MTDTAQPDYPVDACNENGPYPQDVAIRWASYEGSGDVPAPVESVTISTEALHLDVTVLDGQQSATYTADPGDGTAPMTIELDIDGLGGVGCYYASAGTYTVIVARDGTTIATQDVNPA